MHEILCFRLLRIFLGFSNTNWISYKILGWILQKNHTNHKKASKKYKFARTCGSYNEELHDILSMEIFILKFEIPKVNILHSVI